MVSQNSTPGSLVLCLTTKPLLVTAVLSLSGVTGPTPLPLAMAAPELMFLQLTCLPCSAGWRMPGLRGNPGNSRVRLSRGQLSGLLSHWLPGVLTLLTFFWLRTEKQ